MSIVAPRFQKQALLRFFTKIPRPLLAHYILANLHQDSWFDREGKLIDIGIKPEWTRRYFCILEAIGKKRVYAGCFIFSKLWSIFIIPIILLVPIILVVSLIVIVVVVIFSIVTVIVINFECVVLQKAPRHWVKSKFFLRNKTLLSTSCHKHTCGWLSLNSNILISGRYRPLKPEITDVVVWILLIDFLGCNLGLGRKKISNCKSANFRLNALTAA